MIMIMKNKELSEFLKANNLYSLKDYYPNINILSLDHDLRQYNDGSLRKTGYDLVKFICQNNIKINKIYLHTDNPVGKDNMYETLEACKRRGILDKNMQVFKYPYVANRC